MIHSTHKKIESKSLFQRFTNPKSCGTKEFVEWAQDKAVIIDDFDGSADVERLSFLDSLLEDKRIVYLGEEDHWIHEKYQYRLLFLRYLASRGWRFIGEELGWSDGVRINEYIQTGDQKFLERIATYGYRGDMRTDRDDTASGLLKADNHPLETFKAEQIRFAKALRKINTDCVADTNGIKFFGFDINAAAGGGYADIEQLLYGINEKPLNELQNMLKCPPGESIEQEIVRLNNALKIIEKQENELKMILGDNYAYLRQNILAMRDSFDYFRVSNPAKTYRELNIAMAAREELMQRNATFILSEMNKNDKLVLMAHNRHLSKNIDSIKKAGASPPGGKLVPSIGTYLNRLLPGKVFSIWMLFCHGVSSQPISWLSSQYTSAPGSLNSILSEVGSTFILPTASNDTRAKILKKYMYIVGIYNIIYKAKPAEQADAIFFINEVQLLNL